MRFTTALIIVGLLISCSSGYAPYKYHGRVYKAKGLSYKVPNKGYPVMEKIPYSEVKNIPHAELFTGLQLKYDSIAYRGISVDTIFGIPQKFHRFQILLSSKFPFIRGPVPIIHKFIDNTAIFQVSIVIDEEDEVLKKYAALAKIVSPSSQNDPIFLCQNEDHPQTAIFLKHNLGSDHKDFGVFWIGHKLIKIGIDEEQIRSTKTYERIFGHQLTDWGDYPTGILFCYLDFNSQFYDVFASEERYYSYVQAIRFEPPDEKSALVPNIAYDWNETLDTRPDLIEMILSK
ncbi:MAG: hypothetical protein R2824_03955 [Saprospiraceae bacterium]